MSTSTATFGSGCFWCTEAVFQQLRGVSSVVSGYSGGEAPNPTYQAVCTGTTGHAECIQLKYDPEVVSFRELLDVFFRTHDPTTLNRQGADTGTQYRSVIYFHDEQQQSLAETYRDELNAAGVFSDPIVTEISPAADFFPAEGYHQNYFVQNPEQAYCMAVIAPKLARFQEAFSELIDR